LRSLYACAKWGPAGIATQLKSLFGGDLTQPGDALLPFQSQVQELAGRFPKRSLGQGSGYNFHSIVPRRAASSIEAFQHVQSVNRE
jgi:hypothetical protein